MLCSRGGLLCLPDQLHFVNTVLTARLPGFRVGRMNILREIEDIKNDPKEAEEVFVNMLTIAEADGEIEPAEHKVLEEVGRRLGLRVEDYL